MEHAKIGLCLRVSLIFPPQVCVHGFSHFHLWQMARRPRERNLTGKNGLRARVRLRARSPDTLACLRNAWQWLAASSERMRKKVISKDTNMLAKNCL